MALHHRPEISNMRDAYEYNNGTKRHYSPESNSERSYRSDTNKSYNTPPTSHSGSAGRAPPLVHYHDNRHEVVQERYITDSQRCESPEPDEAQEERVSSVISIVESEDDIEDDLPQYDPPEYTSERYEPSAIPARPADFSELFPSHRRLDIKHDDSTPDGNMNLRVDTQVSIHGRKCDMTLFHLRMHDLRNREFSLRRYCRDSGREVCHSIRKHQKAPVERRPNLQRSLSNAINSVRPKSDKRSSTGSSNTGLRRHDSGYSSMHSTDDEHRPVTSGSDSKAHDQPLMNSIKLEFSNYAQMDVNLSKDKKRYDFDYWAREFAWKRVSQRGSNEVFFQLVDKKTSNKKVLASIRPIPLTDCEAEEERYNGGWIPQCMMWIADEGIVEASKDVADAVVAAGIIALVDDSIRSHFHSEESKLLLIPTSKLHLGVEHVGPARLINEMFNRKDSKFDSQSGHAFSDGPSKASRLTSASTRPSSRDQ